jgi:hypothetical protein
MTTTTNTATNTATTASATYRVVVAREGKWWMVHVPDLDALTQARRLGEVESMARSLIALILDVAPDSIAIAVELEAVEDIQITERLDRLHADQAAAVAAEDKARTEIRALARDLADRGVTVRDIGTMLDVSFQRAQQLISH